MVTPGQKTAMAKVGNTVVFKVDDPVKTKVVSSNDGIIKITEGYQQGSATFNPGGEALTPGVATITITTPSGSQEKVLLTIER